MTVSEQRVGDADMASLAGELDAATVPGAKAAAERMLATGSGGLIVDLRAVTFMDSSGLAMLMILERLTTAAGRAFAVVASPEGACRRTLEVSGMSQDLRILEDPDAFA